MRIFGIDFTSSPQSGKPIVCVHADLLSLDLVYRGTETLGHLDAFAAVLARPGPWAMGCDFPFGQAQRFIRDIGWPLDWAGYVAHAGAMSRAQFRAALTDYKNARPMGARYHKRPADDACAAVSPQMLDYTPTALMFHAGAPMLLASGAEIWGLHSGDSGRFVAEAYPGAAARALIGKRPYKSDTRAKQTPAQAAARHDLLAALCGAAGQARFGLIIHAPDALADDPKADSLDALICAAQAAWVWRNRDQLRPDLVGGPIADPLLRDLGFL